MAGSSFDDALALHQGGRIAEAEAIYRRLLEQQPDHPGALHLLGVVRQQQGDHEGALELIGRAIAVNPKKAVYHNNYGAALQSLSRHEEAAASFRRALAISANYADALANLGMAEASLGHDGEALASLRRALDLDPQHADALRRCAALLKKLGRAGEAVAIYQRAVAGKATGRMHLAFGELLFGLKLGDRAIDQFRRAIELAPQLAEAHFSLAHALKEQGKIEEAAAYYRRAVELQPDSPLMHSNLLLCEQ